MQPFDQKTQRNRTAVIAAASAVAVVAVGMLVVAPLVLRSSSKVDRAAEVPAGTESSLPDAQADSQGGAGTGTLEIPLAGIAGNGSSGPVDMSDVTLPGGGKFPVAGPPADPDRASDPESSRTELPPAGPVDPRIPTDLGFVFPGATLEQVVNDSEGDGRARKWVFVLSSPSTCAGLKSGLEANGVVIGVVSCFSDSATVDGLYRELFLAATLVDPYRVEIVLSI